MCSRVRASPFTEVCVLSLKAVQATCQLRRNGPFVTVLPGRHQLERVQQLFHKNERMHLARPMPFKARLKECLNYFF